MSRLSTVIGYAYEHPKSRDMPESEAGHIWHRHGIGHLVVYVDGREIYLKGSDMAEFARRYEVFGLDCLVNLTQRTIEAPADEKSTPPQRRLVKNKGRCASCGDVMESVTVHDFKQCGCGKSFIDGGRDYLRAGGPVEDLSEWEDAT